MGNFSKLQKTFCLGFVLTSLILILFSQSLAYAAGSAIVSSLVLTAVFTGLITGFVLSHFIKARIGKHSKVLYAITALAISIFVSTLFAAFLWNYFNHGIAFFLFLVFPGFLVFVLLGILFALNLIESKQNLITYLISLSSGLLIGTVLTELVLLYFLGIAWAVFLNICLLLWCVLFDIKSIAQELVSCSVVAAIIIIAFGLNVQQTGNNALYKGYRAINNHYYQPVPSAEFLSSSFLTEAPQKLDDEYPYLPLLRKILYQDLDIKNQNVLILGNGGYQLTQNNTNNIHFTYVNYSAEGRPSTCTFLDVMAGGNNIVTKAEKNTWYSNKLYGVIVSNIFPNNVTLPSELLNLRQIRKVRNALPNNGIAIFNIVASPTLTDLYSKRVDNTVRAIFPSCMEIPLVYSSKPTNIIYICRKSKEEKDNAVYDQF